MRNALLFLVLAGISGCGTAPAPPPIYLGHVATTSGPTRATGEQEVLGIRLAIEELTRASQDRLGDRSVFVKHADARGQLDALEGQAVRLVTLSRVVAFYGGTTAEEVQRLDRSGVPLLTPLGARPRGVTEHVFCTGIAPADQAHALAHFAVQEKGVRIMALVVDERREESRVLAEAFDREFQKAFEEKNGKKEFKKPRTITFGKDAKFGELAKTINPAQVQGVLFAGLAQDYKEWRQALPPDEFLVFFGGADGTMRENEPSAAYHASAYGVDKDLPKTVQFAQKFREAYKEEPDVHAALAYEGIRILVDAMGRAQPLGGERLLEELRQTKDFSGLAGSLTFGPDQQLRRPIFVGRMAGAVFSPLKCYPPPNP